LSGPGSHPIDGGQIMQSIGSSGREFVPAGSAANTCRMSGTDQNRNFVQLGFDRGQCVLAAHSVLISASRAIAAHNTAQV
jgi:hypothetical protein